MKARVGTLPLALVMLLAAGLPALGPAAASGPALSEQDSGGFIVIAPGERFDLSLGSSPSTGYGWHIMELDRSVAEVAASSFSSSSPMPGAGGRSNWTFEGKRNGETTLRLEYSRSWESAGSPTGSFSVHIVVGTGNTAPNVAFLAALTIAALLAAELARRLRERKAEAAAAPDGRAGRPGLGGRLLHPSTAGAMGLAGVLAVVAGLAGSSAQYPRFSLWDNDLSELGVSAGSTFFNWGLIACGVLSAFLALGAMLHLSGEGTLRRAGFALLAGALCLLAAIGILTEAFVMVHFYVSVAFFALFALASLVLGISMARDRVLGWAGRLALSSAAMGILAWFLPSGEGLAIPELAASLPGMLWLGLLALIMARQRSA